MTFPTIPTSGDGRILSTLNTAGGATSTFPDLSSLTKNSGDLLIAIIVEYDGNSTNAEFSSWGGGFTEFVDQATTATMGIGAAYKVSTGSETGTFTVTTADTGTSDRAMILMSIPGTHGSTAPEGGTITNGTTGAANIASLNPSGWDVEDTLWIAVAGSGEDATTGSFTGVASAPTNYGDYFDTGISADVVGGVEGAVAFRQLRAASDDPATFSVDVSSARNSSLLIAVRPAVADPLGPTVTAFETTNWSATTTPQDIVVTGGVTGDQIVVGMGGDNGTGGGAVTAATVTTQAGSTGSWSEPEEHLNTTNQGWTSTSTATLTGDGSVTVRLSRTQAAGQPWGGYAALIHNHGGVGNTTFLGNGATESVSLTTSANSAVLMIGIDWDDLATVAFVPSGAIDIERSQGANVTTYAGYWQEQAAGSRSYGIGTSSTANFTMAVIEVLAASAGETGTASADFGFTATAAGVPTTHGVAAGSFGFTATAAGIDRALGVALAQFGFTATALGVDRAVGTATGDFGFTATASGAAGTPPVTGQATASFGFTGTAAGIRRTPGAAGGVFGFTGSAAGVDRALGTALAAFGFTATAAGVNRALGAAVASFGFTGTISGVPRVRGAAVATFGFTGTASGFAGTPPVTGTASGLFGFTATAQGQPRTSGAASAAFGFTATASGNPRVVAVAVATFGFTATGAGTRIVLGLGQALFGFTGVASGQGATLNAQSTSTVTAGRQGTATVGAGSTGSALVSSAATSTSTVTD